MASRRSRFKLEEIAAKTSRPFAMGPFGSNIKSANYQPTGVPVVRRQNLYDVGGGPFKDTEFVFLSEEKADELSSSNTFPGDIVFVAQGTVGRVGMIPPKGKYQRYVLSQNLMKVSVDLKLADPAYVFYYFRSLAGQHEIFSRVNQTGVPSISRPLTSLRSFEVVLPIDLEEQHAIAQFLSTLDDKIELNRGMNETLEAMARAIFKSWFVDFDPVRAKGEGRQPAGMDAETAELFPSAIANSGLGETPIGWRVSTIGEEVQVVGGSTPSTSETAFWEGGTVHWATPKDLAPLNDFVLLDTERQITEQGLRRIGSGLLPKGTVLLSSRAPIGYLAISEIPLAINQGFIAMECEKELPNIYVLHWARSNMDTIVSRANGTTFLEISKTNFRPMPVLVPSEPVLTRFRQLVEPLYRKIVANLQESNTLAIGRDALLLKLMNGELRVLGAERPLEELS